MLQAVPFALLVKALWFDGRVGRPIVYWLVIFASAVLFASAVFVCAWRTRWCSVVATKAAGQRKPAGRNQADTVGGNVPARWRDDPGKRRECKYRSAPGVIHGGVPPCALRRCDRQMQGSGAGSEAPGVARAAARRKAQGRRG